MKKGYSLFGIFWITLLYQICLMNSSNSLDNLLTIYYQIQANKKIREPYICRTCLLKIEIIFLILHPSSKTIDDKAKEYQIIFFNKYS